MTTFDEWWSRWWNSRIDTFQHDFSRMTARAAWHAALESGQADEHRNEVEPRG